MRVYMSAVSMCFIQKIYIIKKYRTLWLRADACNVTLLIHGMVLD